MVRASEETNPGSEFQLSHHTVCIVVLRLALAIARAVLQCQLAVKAFE